MSECGCITSYSHCCKHGPSRRELEAKLTALEPAANKVVELYAATVDYTDDPDVNGHRACALCKSRVKAIEELAALLGVQK